LAGLAGLSGRTGRGWPYPFDLAADLPKMPMGKRINTEPYALPPAQEANGFSRYRQLALVCAL
jgi:hypothetical protein